jgi:antitoxin ParD1/3/4
VITPGALDYVKGEIMPTRNIELSDHFDRFVDGQVASGRYQDASEVLREGLRLLERQAREDEEKLTVLRKLVSDGLEALDRGEAITLTGEDELADFLAKVGRKASRRAKGRRV